MKNMSRPIHFLGLGIEWGQGLKGPAQAPDYFRRALKEGASVPFKPHDLGQVSHPDQSSHPKVHSHQDLAHMDLRAYRQGHQEISSFYSQTQMPWQKKTQAPSASPLLLNWGGDHSVALATVGAFVDSYPDGKILWIDAHADINTPESSPTGNLHGMPLSILMSPPEERPANLSWLKKRLLPDQLIYLGLRDLDPFEVEVISKQGICTYDMDQVRRRGMSVIAREIFRQVGDQPLHISLDVDGLDPALAPATGVKAQGGLWLSEVLDLAGPLSQCPHLKSIDIVEFNPLLGSPKEVGQTFAAALMALLAFINESQFGEVTPLSQAGAFF